MIGIIDYQRSNLFSIARALDYLQVKYRFVKEREDMNGIDHIILPGVGSFTDAMETLNSTGLSSAIKTAAQQNKPILGICLGMHLMADYGEEGGKQKGLGLVSGSVRRLPTQLDTRIPNIGWRAINYQNGISSFDSIMFYFLHSYVFVPEEKKAIEATIQFGEYSAPAVIRHKNLMGIQFHPEKSGSDGIKFLAQALSSKPEKATGAMYG